MLVAILAAFIVTWLVAPLTIKLAFKLGAIDQPDPRKVHRQTMPRLGGLAIFVGFMLPAVFLVKGLPGYDGIIIGALLMFVVGWLDDLYSLSPHVKLLGQSLAVIVAMYMGVMVHFVTNPFVGLTGIGFLGVPVTFLWLVGITNAVNLIDGLDGLAAGVSAIAALTMGVVAYLQGQTMVAIVTLILAAAILGFLPYNFHPSRTFMGDCGSNFLGFILAALAVMSSTKSTTVLSLFVPIVILGIPIFDTCFAIIRRFYNHQPIFKPDRSHLHHRLLSLGYSHRQSVLIIYGISLFFGAAAVILSFINSPQASIWLVVISLFILWGAGKLGIFNLKRRSG